MKKAAIWNGDFDNLGDQLMMIAIISKLTEKYGEKLQVLLPEKGNLGADMLKQSAFFIYKYKRSLRRMHRWIRQRMSGVLFSDIDIIFDVNGYWLGDPWPAKSMDYNIDLLSRYKSASTLLILMPKSFGPFSDAQKVERVRSVYEMADLVFSRDLESYQYLVEIFGKETKHQLATDFTGSVTAIDSNSENTRTTRSDTVTIIPSFRLVDKYGLDAGKYAGILQQVIDYSKKNGYPVQLVLHELDDDKAFLRLLTRYDEMILDRNPLLVKQIIGRSGFVLSSRYHGIVNALSQGVPCLAFGWAHKYRRILEDYEVPDLLVEKMDSEAIIEQCKDVFDGYENLKIRIDQGARKVKERERRMWEEIYKLIDQKINYK